MTTTEENFYVHVETKYDNKEKKTNSGYKHYIDNTWSSFHLFAIVIRVTSEDVCCNIRNVRLTQLSFLDQALSICNVCSLCLLSFLSF